MLLWKYGLTCKGSPRKMETACRTFPFAMSKMHYKQGKGDPVGFKQFMRQENIKPSTIVRYVGSRLHVLFHLAGIFFFLRGKLLHYLKCICNNRTSLRTGLMKELQNDAIVVQLRALGLLGKLLSGPWMQRFYAKKRPSRQFGDYSNCQVLHSDIDGPWEQPLLTLRAEMDAIGGKLVFSNHFHLELKRGVSARYLKSKSRSQCKYSKSNLRHT